MADEPDNDPAPEPDPTPEPQDDPPAKDEPDWKAEARKWEKRAKDNSDAAARLKEFEDAQKTEVDKLKDRIAELEPQTKEAARLRVALRKGLTETQAKRLMGDTEEDLEQDADELLATFAPAEDPDDDEAPAPSRRPREDLKPGTKPSSEPEVNPSELADSILSDGRL